ncbi:MAG: hypothetical protein JW849_09830 [Phycisphaerae bacterium]|nr:hypothetical protein [Phycisphaerae bacterium]
MKTFRCIALALLLFVPLACQKDAPVDTSGVDPIAKEILDAVAQGNVQGVYDAYFTPEYKQSESPEKWKEIAEGYRQMFGNVVSVKRLRGQARWIGDQFIEGQVVYNVTWDKGVGEVTFDVTEEGGWKVRQMRIDSPQIDERLNALTTQSVK